MEQRILELIREKSEEIAGYGRWNWDHAELGYKEVQTAKAFADLARSLGMLVEEGIAVTGVKAYLKEPDPSKPTVALIGELDALPYANPDGTPGARHMCGHNAQLTGVMGAMLVLSDPSIRDQLDGNLVFIAVPAEEYVDIDYRRSLMAKGEIEFGGGKAEFIRLGAFDDIDISVGHHTDPLIKHNAVNMSSNGFVNKIVTFHGKSTHAAGTPHEGRDALKAAALAMHAIEQHQEFYRDEDHVRVHGFITEGGLSTNIIADKIVMEYCVRAGNIPALKKVIDRVDRSFRGAAFAQYCDVDIETIPGYLPIVPVKDPSVVAEALRDLGDEPLVYGSDRHLSASTDYGELSTIMPVLQFNTGGYAGELHNPNVRVDDEQVAYVDTAALFALTAWKLLKKGGEARKIIEENPPAMTKDEVIALLRSFNSRESYEYSKADI